MPAHPGKTPQSLEKDTIMSKLSSIAAAVALTLGIAATAGAHQGPMGGKAGEGSQHQGMQHGGKHDGKHGGVKHAGRGEGCDGAKAQKSAQRDTMRSLMSEEERNAFREKMRNAKTSEERQQIAAAGRSEMEKRAADKGITLPEHRSHHGRGMGQNAAPATQTN
jgi:hypothetical protein